jgi:hypothetical protein
MCSPASSGETWLVRRPTTIAISPTLVIQVHADDLRGLDGGEMRDAVHVDARPVLRDERLALADDGGRLAVEQDPPRLHRP